MQQTYDEIKDTVYLKNIPTKRTGYSLNPGICEVVDLNNTLIYILPIIVKVGVTIDDVRSKSILKTNQTLIFTRKSSLHYTRPYAITLLSCRRYRWVLSIDCGIV